MSRPDPQVAMTADQDWPLIKAMGFLKGRGWMGEMNVQRAPSYVPTDADRARLGPWADTPDAQWFTYDGHGLIGTLLDCYAGIMSGRVASTDHPGKRWTSNGWQVSGP